MAGFHLINNYRLMKIYFS